MAKVEPKKDVKKKKAEAPAPTKSGCGCCAPSTKKKQATQRWRRLYENSPPPQPKTQIQSLHQII